MRVRMQEIISEWFIFLDSQVSRTSFTAFIFVVPTFSSRQQIVTPCGAYILRSQDERKRE